MRKKIWALPLLQSHPDIVVEHPEQLCGQWKNLLGVHEISVEIGCGKGDYWISMAKKHPERGWIAIEKDYNVAAVALRKMLEHPLRNMRLIVGDAKGFDQWFSAGEIDVIHLNFSDPWPKKGHSKRRLSHGEFLTSYHRALAADGEIRMKTDNSQLFEFTCVSMAQHPWKLREMSVDFRRDEHPEDAITEYEQRFMDLNMPIYRGVWRKINE